MTEPNLVASSIPAASAMSVNEAIVRPATGTALRGQLPAGDLEAAAALEAEISGARAAFDLGANKDAISRLEGALATQSPSGSPTVSRACGMAQTLLGRAYEMDGNAPAARSAFESAIELLSPIPETELKTSGLRDLGIAKARTGDPDEGIRYLQLALKATSPEIHQQLGLTYLANDRPHEAVAAFQRALELAPLDVISLMFLPRALENDGALEQAAESYRSAGDFLAAAGGPLEALDQFDKALALVPRSAKTLASKADALRLLEQFDEARAAVAAALEIQPDFPDALLVEALLDAAAGQDELASTRLERLLTVQPEHGRGLLLRGELRLSRNDLDGAQSDLETATRIEPDNWLYIGVLARIRAARGDFDQANRDLDHALELNPGDPWLHTVRAEILLAEGRASEALDTADLGLRSSPTNVPLLRVRASALRALGRPEEAATTLEQVTEGGSATAEVFIELGDALRMSARYEDAATAYRSATERDAGSAAAEAGLAESLRLLGRYKEAKKSIDAARALDPSNTLVLGIAGQIQLGLKDLKGSLKLIDRALGSLPASAWLHAARGDALRASGDFEGALSEYAQAAKIEPDSMYEAQRGDLLRLLGRHDEALDALTRALELNKDNWFALGTRGQVRRERGERGPAIEDLARALEGDPSLVWAHLDLGLAYWESADYPSAIKQLEGSFKAAIETPFARAAYGDALREVGRTEDGLDALDAALAADATMAMAHVSRANALRTLDRYDEALDAAASAVGLTPEYGWALSTQGLLFLECGRFADATRRFEQKTKLTGDDAWTYGWLGYALLYLPGQASKALKAFDKALKLEPENFTWTIGKGDALRLRGRKGEAHDLYQATVDRFHSGSIDAVQNEDIGSIAWSLFRLDQVAESARLLRRILSRNPDATLQFNLALLLLAAGDDERAGLEYDRGLGMVMKTKSLWRRRGLLALALGDLRDAGPAVTSRASAASLTAKLDAELATLDQRLGVGSPFDPKPTI